MLSPPLPILLLGKETRSSYTFLHCALALNAFAGVWQVLDPEERVPSRQGGSDVQILRLDDETRRSETYRRIGGSEILSLEDNRDTADANDAGRRIGHAEERLYPRRELLQMTAQSEQARLTNPQ